MEGRAPAASAEARPLRPADFAWIRNEVGRAVGIRIDERKEPLVRARLMRRLRALRLDDFGSYVARVRADRGEDEYWAMIESLAITKTSFFRDPEQLEALRPVLAGLLDRHEEVRIWSAGCSSGEEPYTIAMLALQWQPEAAARIRVLGTDLSRPALARARAGRYGGDQVASVPPLFRERFFAGPDGNGDQGLTAEVRARVAFARLNLVDPWPMRRPFHVILCRNVVIYFDDADRRNVLGRLASSIVPGGVLFTGRSEGCPSPAGPIEDVRASMYRIPFVDQ